MADRVSSNPWQSGLEPRQRAIVDLALALAGDSARFGEHDLDAARGGPDRRRDLGRRAITALFAMSNRLRT